MDAFEIAERCNMRLKKAREVAKVLSLPTGKKDERPAKMRLKLCRGQQLTARELLILLNDSALFRKLGKYESLALTQVVALGNVRAAPMEVTKNIDAAAMGNSGSVETIMHWLKSVIPPEPVRYHWIAVRLLFDQWPNVQSRDFGKVDRALRNVRTHPQFQGWSSKRPVGEHNPMFYHRPKWSFDL